MKMEEYYAQYQEDKILNTILENKKDGFFIDVGANDGKIGSNSFFFEQLGWKGILIEPILEFCEKMKVFRKNSEIINAAVGNPKQPTEIDFFEVEGVNVLSSLNPDVRRVEKEKGKIQKRKVQLMSLNQILGNKNVTSIDFISIDVEGLEPEVLRGIDLEKYQPRFLIIEGNYAGGDKTVDKILSKADYQPVLRTGCNDWYCKTQDPFFKELSFLDERAAAKKIRIPLNYAYRSSRKVLKKIFTRK